jgi:membrane protein YdbS with pleckstrin-like domain
LGIFFAFASVVLLATLAFFALMNDYPAVASGIIVVIASVAGIFILFRNRRT